MSEITRDALEYAVELHEMARETITSESGVVATLPHITLEQFMPQEAFIIQAQAGFVANEDRAAMINFASHLEIKEGSEVVDNGVSQVATVKNGVASLAKGIVPNPIQLAPYRTFTEVVQPESQFVFRINGRAQLALFEADGGAWTLEAVNNVAAYLKEKLSEQEHLTILA